jgi:hypothetical protein
MTLALKRLQTLFLYWIRHSSLLLVDCRVDCTGTVCDYLDIAQGYMTPQELFSHAYEEPS